MQQKNSLLLFSWGSNTHHQLPLNTSNEELIHPCPKTSQMFSSLVAVAAGEMHSLFLNSSGKLFACGSPCDGRLGLQKFEKIEEKPGPQNYISSPEQLFFPAGLRVLKIACGAKHSLAVVSSGEAYSWGYNETGALSVGDLTSRSIPSLVKMAESNNKQQGLAASSIVDVAAGNRHSLFLCSDGRVFAAGENENGQLGLLVHTKEKKVAIAVQVPIQSKICLLACGNAHSLFISENNEIYACGANSLGQLGLGHRLSEASPQKQAVQSPPNKGKIVQVSARHHSAFLNELGEVYIWGTAVFGQYLSPVLIENLRNIVEIRMGECFGSARDSDGNIFTWGNNTKGQLGLGDLDIRRGVNQVLALQGFKIEGLVCGYDFMIAFGRDREKKAERRKPSIEFMSRASQGGHSRNNSSNIIGGHSRNNSNLNNNSIVINQGSEIIGGWLSPKSKQLMDSSSRILGDEVGSGEIEAAFRKERKEKRELERELEFLKEKVKLAGENSPKFKENAVRLLQLEAGNRELKQRLEDEADSVQKMRSTLAVNESKSKMMEDALSERDAVIRGLRQQVSELQNELSIKLKKIEEQHKIYIEKEEISSKCLSKSKEELSKVSQAVNETNSVNSELKSTVNKLEAELGNEKALRSDLEERNIFLESELKEVDKKLNIALLTLEKESSNSERLEEALKFREEKMKSLEKHIEAIMEDQYMNQRLDDSQNNSYIEILRTENCTLRKMMEESEKEATYLRKLIKTKDEEMMRKNYRIVQLIDEGSRRSLSKESRSPKASLSSSRIIKECYQLQEPVFPLQSFKLQVSPKPVDKNIDVGKNFSMNKSMKLPVTKAEEKKNKSLGSERYYRSKEEEMYEEGRKGMRGQNKENIRESITKMLHNGKRSGPKTAYEFTEH